MNSLLVYLRRPCVESKFAYEIVYISLTNTNLSAMQYVLRIERRKYSNSASKVGHQFYNVFSFFFLEVTVAFLPRAQSFA